MTGNEIALLAALTGGTFLLSGGITLFVIVRLPHDYFREDRRAPVSAGPRPVLRTVLRVLKNLAGAVVVLIGIVQSVPGVPGQGILTILIGVMLLEFPGKYKIERRIIGIRRVRGFVDRLRTRFGRRPLDLP